MNTKVIPENEIANVVWDHEKRIGELEKIVPGLVQQMTALQTGVTELKTIVIEGNRESIEFMKSVIGHEQNMDIVKQQFKQDVEKVKLDMKKQQLEAETKQREDKENWEREQKAENRKLIREAVTKAIAWGAPIVTVAVTAIVQLIETFTK